MKTLVIILSETRAHELTYQNFQENVLQPLQADLCVCIGVKEDYDTSNPFYQNAKYRFTYPEPDDFGDAFDKASQELMNEFQLSSNENIPWRHFLRLKDQFMGGVKDTHHQHLGSAGILIFFRWFLLKQLTKHGLIDIYDRFVITRSDYIYRLPHPSIDLLNPSFIWIPDCEHYGGYTDRHVVLSKENIVSYLNIFHNMVVHSKDYFFKMNSKNKKDWNLEQLIKFHLEYNGCILNVKEIPYIMYSVRNINGSTRWSKGIFNSELNYYIKYQTEFDKSNEYLNLYQQSNSKDYNLFYQQLLERK